MTGQRKRRPTKTATLEDVIVLIGALSRRGTRIAAHDPATAATTEARVVVTGSSGPVLTTTAQVVAEAARRGWVGPSGDEGALALSNEGRRALKKARSRLAAARAQHAAGGQRSPGHNPDESPLAWLARRQDADGRPMLTEGQLAAGERLRLELTFAGLTPRVTMSWSGLPAAGGGAGGSGIGREIAGNVADARARVTAALRAVGPEAAGILIDVCGHLRGLGDIARAEGWPARSAKLVLQQALSALARHYGLAPQIDVERLIGQRLRHWGAAGYRPGIGAGTASSPDQDD